MVRERDHGTDRRASPCRGTGGTTPGGSGCDRGAAPPGDLAAGAGADLPRGGRSARFRAALGGAAGGPLQRSGEEAPGGTGGPAAAERADGEPARPGGAVPGGAVRFGRAAEGAARGWRAVERPQGRGLDGAASRPGVGASAARLGGAEAARVVGPGSPAAAPPLGHTRAAGSAATKLDEAVAPLAAGPQTVVVGTSAGSVGR